MKGMSTCLFSRSALPSQRAASVWRRLRCGRWCGSWFFFRSNHSQRTNRGLIWVFTAGPYFSHQWCECLLKPTPYTFDQICTICLWREMNRLAGVLLFNSPSLCKWFDQTPALMGASSAILRQYYVPKIAWLKIMKAYDFFFPPFFCGLVLESGDRDLTKDTLTRPLLLNQQPEVKICKYGHQRNGHIHLITSSSMSAPPQVSISSHCCNQ